LLFNNDEPTTYKEAMLGPDSIKWFEAMKIQDSIHIRNQVFELGRPSGRMKPFRYGPIINRLDSTCRKAVYDKSSRS